MTTSLLARLSSIAASCTRRTRSWTEAREQAEPLPCRTRRASFCESSVKYSISWACLSKLSIVTLSKSSVTIQLRLIVKAGCYSKSAESSPTSSNQRHLRCIHHHHSPMTTACSPWPLPRPCSNKELSHHLTQSTNNRIRASQISRTRCSTYPISSVGARSTVRMFRRRHRPRLQTQPPRTNMLSIRSSCSTRRVRRASNSPKIQCSLVRMRQQS